MTTLAEIRNSHPDQWLAVDVTETDPATNEPLTGEVVAEARTRTEIWQRVREITGDDLYVFFTGRLIPEGYATAF